MPHLLIGVQLLACLEDTLLVIWGSGSGFENLRRGRILQFPAEQQVTLAYRRISNNSYKINFSCTN